MPAKRALILSGTFLLFTPAAVESATVTADCDAGGSINKAIGQVKPGDVLLASGTCRENVQISPDVVGITLNGQGKTTVQHPGGEAFGPASPGIFVRGRAITITGFTVRGAIDGIHLSGPAHAVIDGNVITDNKRHGIHVDKGSVAQIVNNTIRGNGGSGINITEGSYARIGFRIPPDGKLAPNVIQGNGGDAISVGQNSSAWIVGNTIRGNAGNGVTVDRNSQADVIGNTIAGNRGDGIAVTHNSGVNLVSERTARREGPNQTDSAEKNGGVGISCSIGGYVVGPLGTLAGVRGSKQIDSACIDRIVVH